MNLRVKGGLGFFSGLSLILGMSLQAPAQSGETAKDGALGVSVEISKQEFSPGRYEILNVRISNPGEEGVFFETLCPVSGIFVTDSDFIQMTAPKTRSNLCEEPSFGHSELKPGESVSRPAYFILKETAPSGEFEFRIGFKHGKANENVSWSPVLKVNITEKSLPPEVPDLFENEPLE